MSKKGGGTQTVETKLDDATREYMKRVYGAGAAAGQQPYTAYTGQTVAGVSPLAPEATERYRQAANFGLAGMGAMAGDPDMIAKMMNPYSATMDPIWKQAQEQALAGVGDIATRSGAFGGGRHGVAEGQALSDIANQRAAQRYGEFNNAMARAGQLAGFGMGANAAQMGAADYYRNIQQQQLEDNYRRFVEARDWDVRNLDVMRSALGGPYGQTQVQHMQSNPLAGAVGGAMTGFGVGGVPGAVIGGVGGLLGF